MSDPKKKEPDGPKKEADSSKKSRPPGPCGPVRVPNRCCSCNNNCLPDCLKWALWQAGFFRCCCNEKSGWRHRGKC